MKKSLIVIILIILGLVCWAQTDFEEYQKQQEQEYSGYVEKEKLAEANYYKQQDSLFIQYKDQIEKLWNEFVESTPKEWVSYNADFSGRSQVDFEKDEIKVAAVVEETTTKEEKQKQEEKAKEIVKEQLISILKEKDEVTNEPILKDQVQNPVKKNEPIKEKEIEQLAEDIVKNATTKVFVNEDGKKQIKYEISLSLMPNNIKTRVEKFKSIIEEFCRKHDVDPKVAMAIIHTESFYNPKAYNRHGNAYGMMQIVPRYAGQTMNYALFKKRGKPSSKQLYDPRTNMEMGIGYIRWLANNKWPKVKNKTNQYWAIICSYNGGPGSVYKAMTGKMNKISQKKWDKMMDDLNTMDSDKLYKKLHKDIPWEETRKYIKIVKDRMDKYYKDI